MPNKDHHLSIEAAIEKFAGAYDALEILQKQESEKTPHEALLPSKGDQKTGLIGEYWAIRYARKIYPKAQISFGRTCEKGWDLKVKTPRKDPRYIQVKTASAFGKGRLSPLCKPSRERVPGEEGELPDYWNELWLIWLDRSLKPVTLWRFQPQHVIFNGADRIEARSMRRSHHEPKTGSACFKWDKAEVVTNILSTWT